MRTRYRGAWLFPVDFHGTLFIILRFAQLRFNVVVSASLLLFLSCACSKVGGIVTAYYWNTPVSLFNGR
jgi:hypothetical protein